MSLNAMIAREEREARLNAPLTRREVLAAIDATTNELVAMNDPDWNRVASAFYRLAEALK